MLDYLIPYLTRTFSFDPNSPLLFSVTVTKKLDIPEEKLADYREAFNMFDKNKKGSIGGNEIQKLWKILDIH